MEINQELLQQLNVLYVEDDERIRQSFTAIFSKLFKNVVIAVDGQDGLEKFSNQDNSNPFNIIISDINMPNLNGMDMLKKIRDINKEIPFIFTTAHADASFLLDAINLGVTHYLVKPIDIKQMMFQIQEICTTKHAIEQLYKTQKSNQTYLDIINKVAIVSKTDASGTITYANDIFCEVSGYDKDELIGVNQRIVRHPDMPTKFFDTLWNDLRDGKVWHGKMKNLAKDGTSYYVDAHIFPIYDAFESMEGWMAVRFLITQAEEEKQKFYKNVISNVKTYKQTQKQLQQRVLELETKHQIAENIDLIHEKMIVEKKKSEKARQQLVSSEDEVCNLKDKLKYVVSSSNDKARKLASKITEDRSTLEKQTKVLDKLNNKNTESQDVIHNLTTEVERLSKRVIELEDVIKFGI